VRQHEAREEEAAKASWLDFDASASGAGFEQLFSILLILLILSREALLLHFLCVRSKLARLKWGL
jgi:hypothetical protein